MATTDKTTEPGGAIQLWAALRCLRPRQWTKNLLLFAGLVFTSRFTDLNATLRVTGGFLIFCLLSGVIYVLNDLRDIEQDRLHPVKCLRPIACGAVSQRVALTMAVILGVFSLLVSFTLGIAFATLAVSYFVLNLLYSLWLKHVVIVDILCIAMGFVIRALAGVAILRAMDSAIEISQWFLLCAFFLALFLAICKRRHELALTVALNGGSTRKVIEEYSPALLDQMVAITTTSTIMTYALWAALGKFADERMIYTLPLVVFGIFRYLYLVYRRDEGGEPESILLADIPMIICVLLWLAAVTAIMFQASAK